MLYWKAAQFPPGDGVKILGNGELTKKLNVKVNAVSETAKAKIVGAGGTVEVISCSSLSKMILE